MASSTTLRSDLLTGPFAQLKGRGARSNADSRFLAAVREFDPDFLEHERLSAQADSRPPSAAAPRLDETTTAANLTRRTIPLAIAAADRRRPTTDAEPLAASPRTRVSVETARSIISRNQSPDISFDRSVNPYRGCEHGCIYCYARPTHAYLGLSPGVDFESRLYAKTNAATLLAAELRRPGYRAGVLALGANTDPYQPIEERYRITRSVLQVLADCHHPVSITTKSALVLRDLDLLRDLAARRLVRVQLSVATLDRRLARTLEPRASTPSLRLETIGTLARAGVPTGVTVAPLIPALTDPELEAVLEAAADSGAQHAAYSVLRLPLEVRDLFLEWMREFAPLRAQHVMSLVRQLHDGADYRAAFGQRMSGAGIYARLLQQRFKLACRRLGLTHGRDNLDSSAFRAPTGAGAQGCLFADACAVP